MAFLKHILFFSFLLIGLNSFAQTDSINYGTLEVKVIDAKTKKPIEFTLVTIEKDSFKKRKYSNKNGEVIIDSLPIGTYSVKTGLTGYKKTILENVILKSNTITKKTMVLETTIMICDPVINQDKKPLIKRDDPTQFNLNKQQIMRMPF
jgi:hypothetical protein